MRTVFQQSQAPGRAAAAAPTGGRQLTPGAMAVMWVAVVGLAGAARTVAVRDSKNPAGAKLAFTRTGWSAFTRSIKGGAFDG